MKLDKLEHYRDQILKSQTEITEEKKKDKIEDSEDIITNQYLKLLSQVWRYDYK